jgi:sugar phosphate isomerase/epimerase
MLKQRIRAVSGAVKTLLLLLLLFPTYIIAQEKIGIEFYSFRNQFSKDVPGTLAKITKMGFSEAESPDTYGLSNVEFKKLLMKSRISLVGIGADFTELATDPKGIVMKAKELGSKYVVCFWIPHEGNDFTPNDANSAIEIFNKAGKILKENDLEFFYHPHGFEFRPYNNETLFDYMMKNLDPRYVNFEMDVFWMKHSGQDPIALLKQYPGRFKLMHLKDRKHGTEGNLNGKADVETNVVLGTGDVGIAEIMKVAKQYGVEYFFIEDESSRSEEQVPQSLNYLKNLKQ